MKRIVPTVMLALLCGCWNEADVLEACVQSGRCVADDAGVTRDAGPRDAGIDAGAIDSGVSDAGFDDAGLQDGGLQDAGSSDAGNDAGALDAGTSDAGTLDAGPTDAGGVDAGLDAGRDAGSTDAGVDAGSLPLWSMWSQGNSSEFVGSEQGHGLALAGYLGGVVLGGRTASDNLTFGPLTTSCPGCGYTGFLLAVDALGAPAWLIRVESPQANFESVAAVAARSLPGEIAVLGEFSNNGPTAEINGVPFLEATAPSQRGVFVGVFAGANPNAPVLTDQPNLVLGRTLSTNGRANAIAYLPNGDLIVGFESTVVREEGHVMRLEAGSLNTLWDLKLASTSAGVGYDINAIAAATDGGVFALGTFVPGGSTQTAIVGSTTYNSQTTTAFATRLNPADGGPTHAIFINGPNEQTGQALTVLNDGSVVAAVRSVDYVNFSTGTLTTAAQLRGAADVALAGLTSGLSPTWAQQGGSLNNDTPRALAVLPSGDFVLATNLSGDSQFNTVQLTAGSVSSQSPALIRYAPSGSPQVARALGPPTLESQIWGVVADPQGGLFIAGQSAQPYAFEAAVDGGTKTNSVFIARVRAP